MSKCEVCSTDREKPDEQTEANFIKEYGFLSLTITSVEAKANKQNLG